jgi:hypothetical protein
MGFDKLINFICKNLSYDSIEDININSGVKKIVVNHIMFDISFLIYKNFIELEEEVNNIIKIILALPFNFTNNIIQEKLSLIIEKSHWSWLNISFDGINEDEIINNFIKYISVPDIIEKIIIIKIFDNITDYINKIHNIDLLKSINIIFDGIPSFSKVLEQRRRRTKNYLESQERKNKFDTFFTIDNSFQQFENLNYDYFKWLKIRFTLDKSFGPISPLITKLETYLNTNLKLYFSNIQIFINSGKNNGEADYKMFQNIYNQKYTGDICIHTIDSDLVHQILVQQNYLNIIKKDINLYVIRYNYKINHIQYIDAKLIIKNIYKLYTDVSNIDNSNNINNLIIWDICLLFYFFGNDHLPSSYEIGSELSLEYLLKIHYNIFKNKSSIINFIDNKINFSFTNFNLLLKEIYKNNEINKTKILLGRFFKITHLSSSFLTDKLGLTFDKILLLCRKLLFDNGKIQQQLEENDIRYKLINKYNDLDYPFDINNLKNVSKNDCIVQFDKLLQTLDILDTEENYCGLPIYIKPFYLSNNTYQDLYTTFTDNISSELEKKNPLIYDYFNIRENTLNLIYIQNNTQFMTKSYIKKIYHLVTTLFGDMSNYNSNNFTYYKYYQTPSLYEIINYIELEHNNLTDIFNKEIDDETKTSDTYLNSINHHIIITPYIKSIIKKINSDDIEFLIQSIDLDNLWFNNEENFKYKDFDINLFLIKWFNSIIKLKSENLIYKIPCYLE